MAHDHDHDHEEHEHITIIDENGNEELYEILFTFDSDDFEKSYVLVYPAGSEEGEEVELQEQVLKSDIYSQVAATSHSWDSQHLKNNLTQNKD